MNICIKSGKILGLESPRGRPLKQCPHQQSPLAPWVSAGPLSVIQAKMRALSLYLGPDIEMVI